MAITVIDEIVIKNDSTRYVIDVSRVKGGWQTVADSTERDAIPAVNRKAGMVVEYPDNTRYKLANDLTTWNEVVTTGFIPSSEKGAVNGVVPLNSSQKIDSSYLPNLFLNSAIGVDDITEMLALTTLEGTLIIVADATDDPSVTPGESATYYKINNDDPSALDDFLKLEFGSSVISVNGETGVVTISITSLLSEEANEIALNSFINTSDYAVITDSAISTLESTTDDLETRLSVIEGDAGDYLSSGDNISELVNDSGYLTSATVPDEFLLLDDVAETTFTGSAGKAVVVNETEDGLIFGEVSGGITPEDIINDFSTDPDDETKVAGANAVYDIKQVADGALPTTMVDDEQVDVPTTKTLTFSAIDGALEARVDIDNSTAPYIELRSTNSDGSFGFTLNPTTGEAILQDGRTTKEGLLLLGLGETDKSSTDGDYSDLLPTSLVPKQYVDAEIAGIDLSEKVGASSMFANDNRLVRTDGTSRQVQQSGITIDDSDNVTGVNQLTADQLGNTQQTVTPTGTTQTIDFNAGGSVIFNTGSATGTITLTLSNPIAGRWYSFKVVHGATARNLTFPAGTIQQGELGVTYTASGNNKIDFISIYYDGTNYNITVAPLWG
jgi:hypothetical protein